MVPVTGKVNGFSSASLLAMVTVSLNVPVLEPERVTVKVWVAFTATVVMVPLTA